MLHQLPLSPLTKLLHTPDIVPQDSTPPVNSWRGQGSVPFRVSELKEIKKDLGNYTENPDQYIQALKEVNQNFELSWRDVMLLLSQTLTALEKQWVLDQAVKSGDNCHLNKSGPIGLSQTGPSQEEEEEGEERQRPKREPQFPIPTDQAVPRYDAKWDPENDKDEWSYNHLIHSILEGLRRAKVKPLSCYQVMTIQQGPLETPVAFQQRLKDGLQNHTNIVPESQEEEIILKDKFLTQ
jgi:hypothetical protein